ncbi:unnamed protein product [Rotaria sp. Silwood1]|nr:unnamed protein product [Rotaria sp. Silwood1]
MEKLSLINHQSRKHKQSYKSINDNYNLTIVKYNYLITLDIETVRDDCIEELLFNTKTCFHNNIVLYINYKSLERVTHNFTRDITRINCAKEKIPNLKCFVLLCASEISRYKESLLPLIYRMSNVEKFGLYLTFYVNDKFIDGNYLKKNIINHLPQLNAFTFDIHSLMFINNQMNLPSQKDIEETFRDFQYTKIISYVDYFLEKRMDQCHVFSYPSEMLYYQKITNNFPGGLYQYIRFISLYDEYPFEHEFLLKFLNYFHLWKSYL